MRRVNVNRLRDEPGKPGKELEDEQWDLNRTRKRPLEAELQSLIDIYALHSVFFCSDFSMLT